MDGCLSRGSLEGGRSIKIQICELDLFLYFIVPFGHFIRLRLFFFIHLIQYSIALCLSNTCRVQYKKGEIK